MEYAVKAETFEGNVMTLRRGFPSHDAAEDHPVQMSLWKRVWVEELPPAVPPKPASLPPRPWTVLHMNNHGSHMYLVDAKGRKIMSLLCSLAERELMATHITELVNAAGQAASPTRLPALSG